MEAWHGLGIQSISVQVVFRHFFADWSCGCGSLDVLRGPKSHVPLVFQVAVVIAWTQPQKTAAICCDATRVSRTALCQVDLRNGVWRECHGGLASLGLFGNSTSTRVKIVSHKYVHPGKILLQGLVSRCDWLMGSDYAHRNRSLDWLKMIDSPNCIEFEKEHTLLMSRTPIVWSQISGVIPYIHHGFWGVFLICWRDSPHVQAGPLMSNPRRIRPQLARSPPFAGPSLEPSPPGHVVRSLCQMGVPRTRAFRRLISAIGHTIFGFSSDLLMISCGSP